MSKKIAIFVFIVFVIMAGVFFIKNQKAISPDVGNSETQIGIETEETKSLCYLYSKKTDRGFFDNVWLRLDLAGEKVTGEFNNYLAEKDSKVGKFEGTVGIVDQMKMARTADVWWDTFGEGMRATEELIIEFGDGSASVGAGELIDRGDGVYVYKDKTKLFFNLNLGQIACEDLAEKITVEKYVRENIKTIATNKPVLGGSWYVMDINVIPSVKSGEVVYEDGHIQSSASFEYDFDAVTGEFFVKNFKVKS